MRTLSAGNMATDSWQAVRYLGCTYAYALMHSMHSNVTRMAPLVNKNSKSPTFPLATPVTPVCPNSLKAVHSYITVRNVLVEPRLRETQHAALMIHPLSPHQASILLASDLTFPLVMEGRDGSYPLLYPVFTSSLTSPVLPPQSSGDFRFLPHHRRWL